MIKHIYKPNRFITVTTRRSNYTDLHFGKFTFWNSKQDYDKGNCTGCVTFTGVPLGNCKPYLEIEAHRFIDKIMKEEINQ